MKLIFKRLLSVALILFIGAVQAMTREEIIKAEEDLKIAEQKLKDEEDICLMIEDLEDHTSPRKLNDDQPKNFHGRKKLEADRKEIEQLKMRINAAKKELENKDGHINDDSFKEEKESPRALLEELRRNKSKQKNKRYCVIC